MTQKSDHSLYWLGTLSIVFWFILINGWMPLLSHDHIGQMSLQPFSNYFTDSYRVTCLRNLSHTFFLRQVLVLSLLSVCRTSTLTRVVPRHCSFVRFTSFQLLLELPSKQLSLGWFNLSGWSTTDTVQWSVYNTISGTTNGSLPRMTTKDP